MPRPESKPSAPERRQPSRWVAIAVCLGLLLVFGLLDYFGNERETSTRPFPAPSSTERSAAEPSPSAPMAAADKRADTSADQESELVIRGVSIRDENGRIVYRGDVDLAPTLARIERGDRLRFPNDGSTFENRERRLPTKPRGYYREFVQPTPGEDGPGAQRLVVGRDGEVFYTPDHYSTFRKVR